MNEETNQGNPNDEFGSSDEFFDRMDREVNGAVLDEDQPVDTATPQDSGPAMETRTNFEGPEQDISSDYLHSLAQ